MKKSESQVVDLLISHSQISIRARDFDESLSQWGKINVNQGAVLHDDYVMFDPLPDDAFGANVVLAVAENFNIDQTAQRCILVPFTVTDKNNVTVFSATEKFKVNLNLVDGLYLLYYEVCEGEEIYYKFTFVPSHDKVNPHYLLDDPWGGEKDKALRFGVV